MDLAVQVDVTRVPRELEHPEGEGVVRPFSISFHSHCVVTGTADHKEENT